MSDPTRATFGAEELSVVLSHYDIGIVESVTAFPRGSRKSPKVGIVAEHGKFLLKRRAGGRAVPERVRFSHRVQTHLAEGEFPLAKIISPRDTKQTFVQLRENIYELFEFIAGQPYERTEEEASEAGITLARFHEMMGGMKISRSLPVPTGDYHDATRIRSRLFGLGSTLSSHDSFSGDDAELASLVQFLLAAYDEAAESANAFGFGDLPESIVHGDWHPGNLLYRKKRVLAVIDFDAARRSRCVIDIANGSLQFSMLAKGDPATWPDHVDAVRFGAFLRAYESLRPLSDKQRACIPHLMIEAIISECVLPIYQTGSMGQWTGFRVLKMVRRKVRWIVENGDRLVASDSGPAPSE